MDLYNGTLVSMESLATAEAFQLADLPPSAMNSTNQTLYDTTAYFGDVFYHFNYKYRQLHGCLSLVVCVFGIIANVLNIIVLTRKNMESPTNAILTGMAVSDLLVIASYIPFVIHNFFRSEVPLQDMYTYGWAVFTLFHAHNTVLFHTISIWLTVLLAVWRYITVRTPLCNKSYMSMTRARLAILFTYLIVPVFCIPVFICFTIYPFEDSRMPNVTLYKVDIVQIDGQHEVMLEKINFWAFSVFLKLIPCILLTCLSLALIRILIDARKRKERLLKSNLNKNHANNQSAANFTCNDINQNDSPVSRMYFEYGDNKYSPNEYENAEAPGESKSSSSSHYLLIRLVCLNGNNCLKIGNKKCPSQKDIQMKLKNSTVTVNAPSGGSNQQQQISNSSGSSERTTRMLIAVLIMFLVCEFPSGILALLSGILGKVFFNNVYNNFGELMDMLALINSAVNFVLYCLMSQQFRKTFSQLFCIRWTEERPVNRYSVKSTWKRNREQTVATELVPNDNFLSVKRFSRLDGASSNSNLNASSSLNAIEECSTKTTKAVISVDEAKLTPAVANNVLVVKTSLVTTTTTKATITTTAPVMANMSNSSGAASPKSIDHHHHQPNECELVLNLDDKTHTTSV